MTASMCIASAGGYAVAAWTSHEESAPSDEWVRKAFARADPQLVQNTMDATISYQLKKLKMGYMDGKITVAIDKHLIPRYDKTWNRDCLIQEKGTWKFGTYISNVLIKVVVSH